MKTTVLIARHGNTFDPGDTILRVGCHTDLPLSHSGEQQAMMLGRHLAKYYPQLQKVYTSPLRRAQKSATLAVMAFHHPIPIAVESRFIEVDYGVDEGRPETEVRARLGDGALRAWEENDIPPPGWSVDTDRIKVDWRAFLEQTLHEHAGKTVLVVTSQGIARFVRPLLRATVSTSGKLATGALACLTHDGDHWQIRFWNRKPDPNARLS